MFRLISSKIISVKMGLFFEEITFITELLGSNFLLPTFLTGGKWDFQVADLLLATANFEPWSHSHLLFQEVNLNSSTTYKNWIKNPVPIYFQIWVWDLTNPEEVQAGTGKPSIQQKGPYTYR